MSSIAAHLRAQLAMTDDESDELLAAGWSPIIVFSLRSRGFRPCAPVTHDDRTTTPAFLRQTTLPHLHIALEKTATLEDLDTAIFDAGMQHERDMLRMKWDQFNRHLTSPRTSHAESIESRLARLEAGMGMNDQSPPNPNTHHERLP